MKIGNLVQIEREGDISSNCHGPDGSLLTSTFLLCRIGSHVMAIGLWLYNSHGNARLYVLRFPKWNTGWPKSSWGYSPKGWKGAGNER